MELSLNEVESLAVKAARGAGNAWGLADDIGRSARWLAAHDCDWAESLQDLLDNPPTPAACPFRLGCFLADSAGVTAQHRFAGVAYPIWLLPPWLDAATRRGISVQAKFDGMLVAARSGELPTASVPWRELAALATATVAADRLADGQAPQAYRLRPAPGRHLVPDLQLRALGGYAARVYVAATAHSRSRGAGSLTRDDD